MPRPIDFRRTAALGILTAAFCLLPAPRAQADWLVTSEGARVETQGPWRVQGKLVVFKLADGTLSSLRAEQVDLKASEEATREAVARAAEPAERQEAPKPRRKPIAVLTDKDFKPVQPVTDAPATPDGAAADSSAATTAPATGLMVTNWDRVEDKDFRGVVVGGTVKNTTAAAATDLDLLVNLYDETGTLIASSHADLIKAALGPGESTQFQARIEGTYTYSAVKFQARNRGFQTRQAPAAQPEPTPPPPDDTPKTHGVDSPP